jgi:hypothetical protein
MVLFVALVLEPNVAIARVSPLYSCVLPPLLASPPECGEQVPVGYKNCGRCEYLCEEQYEGLMVGVDLQWMDITIARDSFPEYYEEYCTAGDGGCYCETDPPGETEHCIWIPEEEDCEETDTWVYCGLYADEDQLPLYCGSVS